MKTALSMNDLTHTRVDASVVPMNTTEVILPSSEAGCAVSTHFSCFYIHTKSYFETVILLWPALSLERHQVRLLVGFFPAVSI